MFKVIMIIFHSVGGFTLLDLGSRVAWLRAWGWEADSKISSFNFIVVESDDLGHLTYSFYVSLSAKRSLDNSSFELCED